MRARERTSMMCPQARIVSLNDALSMAWAELAAAQSQCGAAEQRNEALALELTAARAEVTVAKTRRLRERNAVRVSAWWLHARRLWWWAVDRVRRVKTVAHG